LLKKQAAAVLRSRSCSSVATPGTRLCTMAFWTTASRSSRSPLRRMAWGGKWLRYYSTHDAPVFEGRCRDTALFNLQTYSSTPTGNEAANARYVPRCRLGPGQLPDPITSVGLLIVLDDQISQRKFLPLPCRCANQFIRISWCAWIAATGERRYVGISIASII
jgi:hypothetical protein